MWVVKGWQLGEDPLREITSKTKSYLSHGAKMVEVMFQMSSSIIDEMKDIQEIIALSGRKATQISLKTKVI